MNKRSTLGGGALLALALLFIGLTLLFNHALRGWRLDLTENRLYTTASGTDRILASIKEPINLYFFYSEKTAQQLPQLKTYGTRVREFLEELTARSNGKLHLHVIDPQPFSEEEDRAAELGVRGAPVGVAGGQFYFGLAGTNATDGHAAIEFFDPNKEQFLEYDVVKLIYQLANPKKPVVAWLSTLPMDGGFDPQSGAGREPWVVYGEAKQLFDLRPLEPNATADRPGHQCARAGAPEESGAGHRVRDRPVRAARRTHPGVRGSARRGRSLRRRPQQPHGGDDGRQVLAFRHAAEGLGRGLQPGPGGGRPRPGTVGHHAPGRGAGAAPGDTRAQQGQLHRRRRHHLRTLQRQRRHRRCARAGEGLQDALRAAAAVEQRRGAAAGGALPHAHGPGEPARWLQAHGAPLHTRRAGERHRARAPSPPARPRA